MVHVSNTMWRIRNRPSNSTSCSDNALHLLVLMVDILYWRLQVTSSSAIWGCVLKGCFERGKFWRAKSRLKGIEDFNLEHWCWVAPRAASSRQIFQLRRTFIHVMMVGLAIFPISLDSSGFLWLESQTSRWVRSASLKQSIVYFFMEGLGGLSCPLELPF